MDRLRAMEAFVAAVEAGSLSAAASRLGLSNASVTAALQGLEAHLRATLLRRSTRHLRLTPEGETYYARCKAILAELQAAEAEIGQDEARGVLRLQVPIAIGHLVLAPALAAFAEAHPGLRVVTILGNEVDNLLKRGIDVAIRMDEVDTGDLVARPIYRCAHVVCAAPDFLQRHGVPDSPAALDPARCLGWVADSAAPPRVWGFRRGEETAALTPAGGLAFNSSDALLSAAVQGAGLVHVLDLLADPHLREGRLQPVLQNWATEEQVFYVVYPRSRFTAPKIRAFADFAAQAFPGPARLDPSPPIRIRRR